MPIVFGIIFWNGDSYDINNPIRISDVIRTGVKPTTGGVSLLRTNVAAAASKPITGSQNSMAYSSGMNVQNKFQS